MLVRMTHTSAKSGSSWEVTSCCHGVAGSKVHNIAPVRKSTHRFKNGPNVMSVLLAVTGDRSAKPQRTVISDISFNVIQQLDHMQLPDSIRYLKVCVGRCWTCNPEVASMLHANVSAWLLQGSCCNLLADRGVSDEHSIVPSLSLIWIQSIVRHCRHVNHDADCTAASCLFVAFT